MLIWVIPLVALAVIVYRMNGRIAQLEGNIEGLKRRLADVTQAIDREAIPRLPDAPADSDAILLEALTEKPEAAEPVQPPSDEESDADGPQPWSAAAKDQAEPVAAAAVASPVAKGDGIETALGTKWAVWVGGLALAFGGLFLVRYSIEAGWFGPAARLTMAAAFGLVLLGIGEFVRRTGFKVPVQGMDSAYVPSILTAAGAFTLFGAIYAAHAVYGFIGSGLAFTLLGMVGLGTLALALVHGLPMAGLGLIGALATPASVSSQSPNPWALFVYLAIVLVAAVAIARIRIWPMLATAAFAGVGLWALFYLVVAPVDPLVLLFVAAAMVAALALVWLRDAEAGEGVPNFSAPAITVAIFGAAIAIGMSQELPVVSPPYAAAIIAILLAAAVWRTQALPLLHSAGVAAVMMVLPVAVNRLEYPDMVDYPPALAEINALWPAGWALLALFLGAGLFVAARLVVAQPIRAAQWTGWAAIVPITVVASYWAIVGSPDIDLRYAALALALTLIYAAAAEYLARREDTPLVGSYAVSTALAGAGAAAVLTLHAGTSLVWTTALIGLAAALPALATRWRSYPALGWLSVAFFVVTSLRIAYDPSLVLAAWIPAIPSYGTLLLGYGLPALAFVYAAWQLARTTDGRPRLVMEVAGVLFVMLTVAALVRRAMTGGDVYTDELTLAEQAIYTLLALGAGGSLIAIGQRSPSVVMTYGSMALGCLSAFLIATLHFGLLNPLFTDESTGKIPVLNLLFLAYLLPAITAAGVALYARGKRPKWYSAMLGLLASLLAFAYLTLSVRRWYQGEFIGIWRDTTQLETYSYSALWLVFGVTLLVIGVRLHSWILRVASAALIAIAVLKVFLLDMAALEGVLRALSFIGLGAVLIGIGLFYQRLLTSSRPNSDNLVEATPPEPAQVVQPEPR